MALSTEELAEAQANLASAKAAYHRLMTGTSVAEVVDQNGEKVRYSTANASLLKTYIDELKASIAGTPRASLPLRPFFR